MNDEIFCKNSIGLLILAGGKSVRMGQNKAKLDIDGKTFGEYIALNMGKYCENIFSSNDGSKLAGFATIEDDEDIKEKGPASGIVSALKFCSSRWLMVVPCDAPFVDESVAISLWKRARNQDAEIPVLAESKRGLEPLIGLYPKSVMPVMLRALKHDIRKVSEILKETGYDSIRLDDSKLININNPKEYEMIKEKYEQR